MRIGKHPYLRGNCGSAAVFGDKSINYSASGRRAGCAGRFDTGCKACDNCKASCETCHGCSHQDADRRFVADCGKASEYGTKFYGGEAFNGRGGAASRSRASFGVEN
jgi:hypothetical protein